MTGDNALQALVEILEQLQAIVPADQAVWDDSLVVRLAVERLRIVAGNTAEEYRGPQDPDARGEALLFSPREGVRACSPFPTS
ncbi:MAG TPA: hypothetical protein VM142_04165 [Acidimicrobiales bacterium]|nr:hypothetical protein [Acidimicrobiales bacterium]